MQQPQNRPTAKRFSDEETRKIYERAAQIESKTLFGPDDSSLSREELVSAANRAGISDTAVEAAIKQLEQERVEARARAIQKRKTQSYALAAGGALVLLTTLSAIVSQRSLATSQIQVEQARSNVEVALQRRQDLVPNALAFAKENLSNERELIALLSRPDPNLATLQRMTKNLENRGVQVGVLDELAGSENRIAVARRRFNENAAIYNQKASSFPSSLWRGVFGFPAKVEGFQADAAAKVAPKF